MLKISKLTDYAIVLLVHFHKEQEKLFSAHCLAEASHVPEPTVAKILKLLAKSDILTSVRGANGGYRLEKLVEEISVKEVLEAIEGPIHLTECVDEGHDCPLESHCPSYGRWDSVNAVIKKSLSDVKINTLMETG